MSAKLCCHSSSTAKVDFEVADLPRLHRATYLKDIKKLHEILDKKHVDIEKRDAKGRTALHYGCLNGSTEVMEVLLSKRADLHLRTDKQGRTPAYVAVQNGVIDCVKLLVKYGHNFDEKDENGICPLHLAIIEDQTEIAAYLIKNSRIDPNAKDPNLLTPLHMAVANRLVSITKLLAESDTKINARDCHGRTPLMLAAAGGSEECLTILIANGANLNLTDRRGLTAKTWAEKKSFDGIVAILNEASSNQRPGDSSKEKDEGNNVLTKQNEATKSMHQENRPKTTTASVEDGIRHPASKSRSDEMLKSDVTQASFNSEGTIKGYEGGDDDNDSSSRSDIDLEASPPSPSEITCLLASSSMQMNRSKESSSENTEDSEGANIVSEKAREKHVVNSVGGDIKKLGKTSRVHFAETAEILQFDATSENESATGDQKQQTGSIKNRSVITSKNGILQHEGQGSVDNDFIDGAYIETNHNVDASDNSNTMEQGSDPCGMPQNVPVASILYSNDIERQDMDKQSNVDGDDERVIAPEITMAICDDTDEDEFPYGHSVAPVIDEAYTSDSDEYTLIVQQPACRPSREFIASSFAYENVADENVSDDRVFGHARDISEIEVLALESGVDDEFVVRSNINLRIGYEGEAANFFPDCDTVLDKDPSHMSRDELEKYSISRIDSLKEKNDELVKELFHSVQDNCVTENLAEGLENKLKTTTSNLEIEKERADRQRLLAAGLENEVKVLGQLKSELEDSLSKERRITKRQDFENSILRSKLELMISSIKNWRKDGLSKADGPSYEPLTRVVESSEKLLQGAIHDFHEGLELESELEKDKKLLVKENIELRRKVQELKCSNEYFEKKVINLNSECIKKNKEIQSLNEKVKQLETDLCQFNKESERGEKSKTAGDKTSKHKNDRICEKICETSREKNDKTCEKICKPSREKNDKTCEKICETNREKNNKTCEKICETNKEKNDKTCEKMFEKNTVDVNLRDRVRVNACDKTMNELSGITKNQSDPAKRRATIGLCSAQKGHAGEYLAMTSQVYYKKIADELKLRFLVKGEEIKEELTNVRANLEEEKRKVRMMSLHDELKGRFVISAESLQKELNNLKKEKETPSIANIDPAQEDVVRKLKREEESKFSAKIEEQCKTINLLRACISETRQEQSKYMQFYADAKQKAELYDELVGSNLQLEVALCNAYKKIDALANDNEIKANGDKIVIQESDDKVPLLESQIGVVDNLEKDKSNLTKEYARTLVKAGMDKVLSDSGSSSVDSGCEDAPTRNIVAKEHANVILDDMKDSVKKQTILPNAADIIVAKANLPESQAQVLLELRGANVKIKNLLCINSDLNEEKNSMGKTINKLAAENAELLKNVNKSHEESNKGPARNDGSKNEDVDDISHENAKLVRELWKIRQSLDKSERENATIKEEHRLLETRFEKIKEKADKLAQNNDTMITMEDILEENASLMEANEEIVEKYKELLKKLNESDEEAVMSKEELVERKVRKRKRGSILANEFGERDSFEEEGKLNEDNDVDVGDDDDGSEFETVGGVRRPMTARKETLISSNITLADLIRAMDSDSSDDISDNDDEKDEMEIMEHVRRASVRYSEGYKEDGSLLEEVNRLTLVNNSLKDKIAFLETWTNDLNQEVSRLQTDVEEIGKEKALVEEKLRGHITETNTLQNDVEKLKEEKNALVEKCTRIGASASLTSVEIKDANAEEILELNKLQEKYDLLQEKSEEWNNELSEKIHRLQKYLQDAYDDNSQLEKTNDDLTIQVSDRNELRSELDKLLEKTESLSAEFQMSKNDLEVSQLYKEKMKIMLESYDIEQVNLQNEIYALNGKIEGLVEENKTTMKKMEEASKENDRLVDIKGELHDDYQDLIEQLEGARISQRSREEYVRELEKECEIMSTEIEGLSQVHEENKMLVVQVEELQGRCSAMQAAVDGGDAAKKDLEESRKILQQCLQGAKTQRLDHEKLQKEHEKLNYQNAKLDLKGKNFEQKLENAEKLSLERKQYIFELEKECEIMSTEIEGLSQVHEENKMLVVQVEELQGRCSAMQAAVDGGDAAKKDLEESRKILQQCLQGAKTQRLDHEKLQKEHEKSKNQNAKLDLKGKNLQQKLESSEDFVAERKHYIFELERECEVMANELKELRIIKEEKDLTEESDAFMGRVNSERGFIRGIRSLIIDRLPEQHSFFSDRIRNALKLCLAETKDMLNVSEIDACVMAKELINIFFDEHERLATKIEFMDKDVMLLHEAREKLDSVTADNIKLKQNENKLQLKENECCELQRKIQVVSEIRELIAERLVGNEGFMSERIRDAMQISLEKEGCPDVKMQDGFNLGIKDAIGVLFDEIERLAAKIELMEKDAKLLTKMRDELDSVTAENVKMKQNENKWRLKEYTELQKLKLKVVSEIRELIEERAEEAVGFVSDRVNDALKLSLHEMKRNSNEASTTDEISLTIKKVIDILFDENERLSSKLELTEKDVMLLGKLREELDAATADNIKMKQNENKLRLKEKECSELQIQIHAISTGSDEKQKEVESLKGRLNELEETIALDKERFKQLGKDVIKLKVLEKENKDHVEQTELIGEEFCDCKEAVLQKNMQMLGLEEQVSDMKRIMYHMNSDLQGIRLFVDERLAECDGFSSERCRDAMKFFSEIEENGTMISETGLKPGIKEIIGVLFDENERLVTKSDILEKDVLQLNRMRDELDSLTAENIKMKQNENKLRLKEKECAELQRKLQTVMSECESKQQETDSLKDNLKQFKDTLETNTNLFNDIKALHQENKILRKENEHLAEESLAATKNIQDVSINAKKGEEKSVQLEQDVVSLRTELMKLDIVEQENKELVEQIESLKEELCNSKETVTQRDKQVVKLEEQLVNENRIMFNINSDLQGARLLIEERLDEDGGHISERLRDFMNSSFYLEAKKSSEDISPGSGKTFKIKETFGILFDENERLTAKIDLMQKDVKLLRDAREQLDRVTADNIKMKQNENKVRLKEKEFHKQMQTISKDCDAKMKEMENLQEQMEKFKETRNENGRLLEDIKSLNEENKNLRGKNESLIEESLELTKKVQNFSSNAQKDEVQLKQLEEEAVSIRSELMKSDIVEQENKDLLEQIESIGEELCNCKTTLMQRDRLNVELEEQIRNLNDALENKGLALQENETNLKVKLHDLQMFERENSQLRCIVEKERQQFTALKERINSLETENEDLKLKLACLMETKEELVKIKTSSQKTNDMLIEMEKEKEFLNEEMEKEKKFLNEKLNDMNQEIHMMEHRYSILDDEHETAKDWIEQLEKDKNILDKEHQTLIDSNEELHNKTEAYKKEISRLQHENEEKRNDVDLLRRELEKGSTNAEELKSIQVELEDTQDKAKEIWEKFLEMKTTAEHFATEHSKLSIQMHENQNKLYYLQEENSVMIRENAEIKAENGALKSSKARAVDLEMQLERKMVELQIAREKYEDLNKRFASVRKQADELEGTKGGYDGVLENIRCLECSLVEARNATAYTAKGRMAAEERLTEVLKENDLLKDEIRINDNNRNADLQEIVSLQKDLEESRKKLSELEEWSNQLKVATLERDTVGKYLFENERQGYELQLQETHKRITQLEKNIEEQNTVISEKDNKYHELAYKFNSIKEEKKEMQQESSKIHLSVERYETKLKENENIKHLLEDKIDALSRSVADVHAENEKLSELYAHSLRNNENLSQEIKSMECKLDTNKEQHDNLWGKYRDLRRELKEQECEKARTDAINNDSVKDKKPQPEKSLEESIHGSKQQRRQTARNWLTNMVRSQGHEARARMLDRGFPW